ncbi:MAG: VOC family protein [Acidimicrobiia bacterium]|nr:VOC family protein [Acidimicrobiia bacterium]
MADQLDLGTFVERLDHIAIGVADLADTTALLELVGAEFRDGGDYLAGGFRWSQFSLPGSMKLELLQPLDPLDDQHFLVRFLASRGEGVHHMTFKVTDIDAAVARARTLGFEVVGVDTSSATWKEAFVHPKSAHGVVVQLAQWEDGKPTSGRSFQGVVDGLYRF